MKIVLDRKEIESVLMVHVNGLFPNGGFNRVEWDGYRNPTGVTIEHTDVPEEDGGE